KKAGLKEKSTQDYQRGVDDGKKMASEESYEKGLKEAARIHAVVWRSFLDFIAIAGIAGLVVGFFPR
ncbi:hypothetical protein C6P44_001178, partial [Monosporozyma unispora]